MELSKIKFKKETFGVSKLNSVFKYEIKYLILCIYH
jgi:hypothetical protein